MIGHHVREALSPVLFLVACVGVAALVLSLCDGCKPAEAPAAEAVVPALARGVKAADKACAALARAKKDADLARDCAFAYDAARLSLDAADDSLDGDGADVPCHVAQALAYTRQMAGLIEKHGGTLPKALTYALAAAPYIAEACHG